MEIANYTYNSTTGRMTFEFDITIKGHSDGYYNSTRHDLNIKGKFDSGEGKIYKDIVSRKR